MYRKYIFIYPEDERDDLIDRCRKCTHYNLKQTDADRILMYKEFVCIKLKTEAPYTQKEFAIEKGIKEAMVSNKLNDGKYRLDDILRSTPRAIIHTAERKLTILEAIFNIDSSTASEFLQFMYHRRSRCHYWPNDK